LGTPCVPEGFTRFNFTFKEIFAFTVCCYTYLQDWFVIETKHCKELLGRV
jgi:hypothetical protein